jgi:hypothetical protein
LIIFGGLILISLVVFIFNYKTFMILTGSGKLNIKTISAIDQAINQYTNSNSSQKQIYSKVSEQTVSGGTKEATYISTDSAVKVNVTQNSAGKETIKGTVDTSKLKNVDVSNVNVGNITQIKNQAEQYITPFLSQDEITGLSAYVAAQTLTQYNNKQKQIVISKDFGDVNLNINADITTNNISFELNKK